MNSPPAVQIENLTHAYFTKKEEVTAIRSVSFSVDEGEFVALVGPSGCGKSTILSLIAGIFPATKGIIRLFGKKIDGPSFRTSYMLQKDGLLEWRTVEQNMLFGLQIQGQATPDKIAKARDLLKKMGLKHVSHHYPSQLSGGMRQRVALVRTLAVEPDILLLDEPFSALDIQNKILLEDLLARALKEENKTALLVTHDLEEAIAVGDRILVMGGQPGEIRHQIHVPEELRSLPPLKARSHPAFRVIFEELWREVEKP
ncbi:ABC transporter ATP-binding protein [Thermoactinomyces sp. CICC 10521]|uniref:ABC transporter ATP-binding protein n=1 Tax=Thermoactinomyces sp. CICC 10521 TaxID=2767426 RepID=UPI0018DB1948|nr:ABC transporter ATP-binding protein [Thermoactinomyces sp. CICC 10521]MBH8606812.1 ABC transporter ATP-binding protein [Thermoactinomyces sp. CICC 10521]